MDGNNFQHFLYFWNSCSARRAFCNSWRWHFCWRHSLSPSDSTFTVDNLYVDNQKARWKQSRIRLGNTSGYIRIGSTFALWRHFASMLSCNFPLTNSDLIIRQILRSLSYSNRSIQGSLFGPFWILKFQMGHFEVWICNFARSSDYGDKRDKVDGLLS